ncbi:MAG: PAS-domain containing protein [Proteobacteria bacterium]|nr:PAS-domain containing protein [Pseudomonadota bacterium]
MIDLSLPVTLLAAAITGALFAAIVLLPWVRRRERMRSAQSAERIAGLEAQRSRDAERLRHFAESASDWFWEQDAELRFTYITDSPLRPEGRSSASYLGQTRRAAHPDAVAETSWSLLEADIAQRRAFREFRYSFIRLNGKRDHISISGMPIHDASGRFVGYRGSGRLMTQEVEAAAEVRRVESRLAAAIDAFPAEFAIVDASGRLAACNQRFRDSFLQATGAAPTIGAESADRVREFAYGDNSFKARGGVGDRAQRFERLRADGCWVQVDERATNDGGTIIVIADISEQKTREADLQAAKEAAERAALLKTQFLATVSHELRTPLNAVIGFSEIMQQELFGPLGDKRYRDYLADIHTSGTHLLRVINDILDVTRIENGSLGLADQLIDLARLVEDCLATGASAAAGAGLALTSEVDDSGIVVAADPSKLTQVLRNLISNAVTFTPAGGRIGMAVKRLPDGDVAIRVSDTGIGMTPAEIQVALTPFGQISNPMTRRHQGLGLGLTLAKSLTELHGGRLEVESAVGSGTTVSVILPAARVSLRRHLA